MQYGSFFNTENYRNQQCLSRKEGSGRRSKITTEIKSIVERQMDVDDQTTTQQLHKILTDKGFALFDVGRNLVGCFEVIINCERTYKNQPSQSRINLPPFCSVNALTQHDYCKLWHYCRITRVLKVKILHD